LLSIAEDSRCSIGLDLANDRLSGAIVNLRGKIKQNISIPLNGAEGENALSLVFQIIDQLIQYDCQPMLGIGIGAPGLIDSNKGLVINAVNYDWKNLHLADIINERYKLPVHIINDCQAAAIAENQYGNGNQSIKNLIVVNIRYGIGSGIIIDGEIYQGDGGSAGEVGHTVVIPDGGELCRCGNRGCLETVASVKALIRNVEILSKTSPGSYFYQYDKKITLDEIENAIKAGDKIASNLVLDSGFYLGMAISWLVGILNIQKIILTGDMTKFGEPWLDQVKRTTKEMSLERPLSNTKIEIGQLGQDGVIIGASAALANDYSLIFNP
jgi:N-acetylglucosamine repressor